MYLPLKPTGRSNFPARSGHTAHLVPSDSGLGVLVLGGRDYRPPRTAVQEGEHHGREDAFLLTLAKADEAPVGLV